MDGVFGTHTFVVTDGLEQLGQRATGWRPDPANGSTTAGDRPTTRI
jgi:hypothetical protein